MAARRVVVDGSNIATEGRTLPSLRQLNEAVLAFLNEYPDTEVTVVVDATFGHRIEASETAEFEEAEANNELVSPPAGAIGRGDAFLLRIAGKIGATVLSNDSFQEFHGEHEWLFEEDRLIGGKPIPGIGWIFTPRSPVRGMKSRKAVKDAKPKPKVATASGEALGPKPVPTKPPPKRKPKDGKAVAEAIATATEESVAGRKRRRKKRGGRPAEPVNDAVAFVTFIEANPLGSQVEGEVETFTSHGAFVQAEGARCYVPISALGDPPPRAARDVLNRGERRRFVVQALDPQRRGIELALPDFAKVSGTPLPETIEAEIAEATAVPAARPASGRGRRKPAASPADIAERPDGESSAPRAKKAAKKAVKAAPAKITKAAGEPQLMKAAPAVKAPGARRRSSTADSGAPVGAVEADGAVPAGASPATKVTKAPSKTAKAPAKKAQKAQKAQKTEKRDKTQKAQPARSAAADEPTVAKAPAKKAKAAKAPAKKAAKAVKARAAKSKPADSADPTE
ncbi:MAG: NYN domain-containing protein [Acidimicrobiales bacterium]